MKLIRSIASWVLGILTLGFVLATASPIVNNAGGTLLGSPGSMHGYRTLSVLNTDETKPDEVVFAAPVLSYSGKAQAALSIFVCMLAFAGVIITATRTGTMKRVGIGMVLFWCALWVYGVLGFCRYSMRDQCLQYAPALIGGSAVGLAWCALRWGWGKSEQTTDG